MTSPAPGWYPDPGGTAPFRWWDGRSWTTATSDGTPPPAAQTATPGPPATANPATPAYGATTQQPMYAANPQFGAVDPSVSAAGPTTAYGTKSAFDSSGARVSGAAPSTYSQVMSSQHARTDTFWHKNQAAMWTFIVVAIYIFIALSTGFGIIGFIPAALAWQSRNRGEPLAPLAIGAAVIAVVVGITTFTHH